MLAAYFLFAYSTYGLVAISRGWPVRPYVLAVTTVLAILVVPVTLAVLLANFSGG